NFQTWWDRRAEIVYQHVSLLQQFQENFVTLSTFQVQTDRALTTVDANKGAAIVRQRGWVFAQVITLGRFDFDNLGAKIGQKRATVRSGDIGAQIQHLDSGQGQCIIS